MPQVAVTAAAPVKLTGDNVDTTAEGVCFIDNRGTNEVYLGGSNVTSATGYQLDAADAPLGPIPLSRAVELYAICAAAETATVHVLTLGS